MTAAILSSAIHYAHNFVMANMYPPLPPMFPNALAFRIGIAVTWPLLTGLALWGYTQYLAGRTRSAGWAFIIYSILGISTIGHFLGPSPDVPAFFFVTIFTDFLTGTAMLLFGSATLRQSSDVGGHENLPIGGHRISPLAVIKSPQWRPSDLPIEN